MKQFKLGRIAGLDLIVQPQAILGSLVLWALLSTVGALWLGLSQVEAILGGLVAVILHWCSELVHNLGHAWAARRTGYPMTGVRLGTSFLVGTSLYPADEPPLPAEIHIRRALGGPLASFLLTVVMGIIALALRPGGGVAWWVALFLFLENLFIFFLGAFLPLGFTDGSTLLEWWGKR